MCIRLYQRITYRSQFSPFTMCILEMELELGGWIVWGFYLLSYLNSLVLYFIVLNDLGGD